MSRDTNDTMEDQVEAATTTVPSPSIRPREGLLRTTRRDRSLRKISDHSSTRRTPTSSLSRSMHTGCYTEGDMTNTTHLGDSLLSLDMDFLEDAVPPPELTRPEPLQRNTAVAPWGRQSRDGTELSPNSRNNRPQTLESIMQEQSQEAALFLHTTSFPNEEESVFIEEINRVMEQQDEEAVEEAMLKLALERSLRSLHTERGGGGSSTGGASSYHNSMRSLASDLAREVQMEADRTELELVTDSSCHTPGSRSSRPSLSRLHSTRRVNEDGEQHSGTVSRRPVLRSNSGSFPSQRSFTSSNSLSPTEHNPRHLVSNSSSRSNSVSPGAQSHNRSGSTPRRGVRRSQSSEGTFANPSTSGNLQDLAAAATSVSSPGLASTTSLSRSTHRSGSGSSTTSGGSHRGFPRQASIRIGPLPKNGKILVEDGTLVDGAEAVLEVARQNLSPDEVELIERALRKGKPLSVVETDGGTSHKRSGKRHQHRSTTPSSVSTAPTVVLTDSRHSTSETSTSITCEDFDGTSSHHQRLIEPIESDPTCYARSPLAAVNVSEEYDLRGAEENLSEEELRQIQQALLETEEVSHLDAAVAHPNEASPSETHISEAERAAIEQALQEAAKEEEMRNFQLALQMQEEEDERLRQQARRPHHQQQGNVRTMTRAEVEAESRVGAFQAFGPPIGHHPLDHHTEGEPVVNVAAGFRMNSNINRHEWIRRDQNSIIGPNQEVRTKHDTTLDGQANAHRLGLEEDEYGSMSHVGNTAYNSFLQSVQRRNKKGVAAHGTGRAGGSDADATKGGAMDANVRLQISRAINNGYIDRCNGVVKEGKEAIVLHADSGDESGGFDVAIKVFKRIQDFKGRGDYVDGDPRYAHENFRRISGREQLELWTEKEFRNLTRATRAGVPVPSPLFHKENILFMRFLGTDGWPAPQLREINIRHGSKKWDVLYCQVMDAIHKLFRLGRLVHGDLSEYNILVVPAFMVENVSPGIENVEEELQAVLIDFGQAVDTRHPDAVILLQQDLDRVKSFFAKQGVETMGADDALAFVLKEDD